MLVSFQPPCAARPKHQTSPTQRVAIMKLAFLCLSTAAALCPGPALNRALDRPAAQPFWTDPPALNRVVLSSRRAAFTGAAAAALLPAVAAHAEVAYERDADGKSVKVERKSALDKLAYKPGSAIPGLGEFLGAAVEGKELEKADAPEACSSSSFGKPCGQPTQQPAASSKLGVNLFLAVAVAGAVFVGTRGADGEQPAPPAASPVADDEGASAVGADSDPPVGEEG